MNDLSRFDLNGVWAPEHHVAPWYNRSRISSCSQRDKDEPGPVWRIFRRFKPQPTSYFQTSSEDIFLSVSLTPFSCPPCLEYLCPRALIRLRLWRYTNHVLTFTYACSTNRGANVQSASRQRATISGTSCRRRWPVRSASSAVSKYQPPSRAAHQTVYCWQPCFSDRRSSSLERSARGRRLIIIIADFPPSIKNTSFFNFHTLTWFFDRLIGIVTVVLVVYCSLFRPLYVYLLTYPKLGIGSFIQSLRGICFATQFDNSVVKYLLLKSNFLCLRTF